MILTKAEDLGAVIIPGETKYPSLYFQEVFLGN